MSGHSTARIEISDLEMTEMLSLAFLLLVNGLVQSSVPSDVKELTVSRTTTSQSNVSLKRYNIDYRLFSLNLFGDKVTSAFARALKKLNTAVVD